MLPPNRVSPVSAGRAGARLRASRRGRQRHHLAAGLSRQELRCSWRCSSACGVHSAAGRSPRWRRPSRRSRRKASRRCASSPRRRRTPGSISSIARRACGLPADPGAHHASRLWCAEAGGDAGADAGAGIDPHQSGRHVCPSRCRSRRRPPPSASSTATPATETDQADMERQWPQLKGQFLIDRDGIVRWANIECATRAWPAWANSPPRRDPHRRKDVGEVATRQPHTEEPGEAWRLEGSATRTVFFPPLRRAPAGCSSG